jgi:hypothetical protein
MLFHAGSEVTQALSSEPDREFVMDARQRFMRAAGAQAQEALRDVPPPRLPFWVNARRRLLEAATNPAPRPAPTYTFAMRSALSAAVILLAVGVAALGFFVVGDPGGGPGTRSASANIEYIEEQLDQIERGRAQGITPPSEVLVELSNLTTSLSAQVAAGQVEAPIAERLPALIQRQQTVAESAVATSSVTQPALVEVVTKLSEAESVVAAAIIETPAATSTSGAAALGPTATATPQPTATKPASTAVATATTEPSSPTKPVKPADVEPGKVNVQIDVTDKTWATASNPLPWVRVTTSEVTFVIAAEWDITNIEIDDGFATVGGNTLTINTGNPIVPALIVGLKPGEGEVKALINGVYTELRSEDGDIIDSAKLLQLVEGNRIGLFLHHFITSIEFED